MIRGLMSDVDWAFFEPFVVTTGPLRGRPPGDHRRTLDGIFWVTRTGAPWRDLPEQLGKWNSVYRQFLRWSRVGLWDFLLEALADCGAAPKTVQMIDSTMIRAHHQAAGAKGGLNLVALGCCLVHPGTSKYTGRTGNIMESQDGGSACEFGSRF